MSDKIYLADAYSDIWKKVGVFCQNNKAHILTGVGVVGTVTTGVLSARSGARAARTIDRKEREIGRKLTGREKAALTGKFFIAPAIAGTLSMVGTVGSDVVNTKTIGIQNAALIASEEAYERLSRKTKEVLGEKKAKQVEDEVTKEKVAESGLALTRASFENAPKVGNGTLTPFVDEYSMLPFWSNLDYIALTVKGMQDMMAEQKSRGDEYDYYDKEIGVPYSEWLKGIGYDRRVWDTPERRHHGWNKGFAEDGSEDDEICYQTVPIEYEPGFAVMALRWEKEPTDMRLGRLIKSSGVGL